MPDSDTELLEEARACRAKARRMRELALLVDHAEVTPLLEQYAAELEQRATQLEAGAAAPKPIQPR